MSVTTTPFWNVNVPPALHTTECPDFLQYAVHNEKDQTMLRTLDQDYRRLTWSDCQGFARDNRLDLFQRVPSELRRYRQYCAQITKDYGSIMAFVMKERLQWQHLNPKSSSGSFFREPTDYKILFNDWPYGIDERITHLVVWTKFSLSNDGPNSDSHPDDLSHHARQEIDRFVQDTFGSACGRDRVLWFKNWSSLKSIHAVEHFHVMLFDPPTAFVDKITGGDMPLCAKVT